MLRPKLSLLNGVAAVGGCLLLPSAIDLPIIAASFIGVALLAAGGSALNQVLERDLDSLMMRTRLRPLPAGTLKPSVATLIGAGAIMGGLVVLGAVGGPLPMLLGAAALLWYLAVYTPLKRRTSLALPAGALCGAVPPLVGWCLAGGGLADFRIMLLAGLLFLWQVPHFWLLQRRHCTDYAQAGIPLFRNDAGPVSRDIFFLLWIVAMISGAVLLPVFGIIQPAVVLSFFLFLLLIIFLSFFRTGNYLFPYINCFPLLLTVLLVIQKQC